MPNMNRFEQNFPARQLFGPGCINQWARLGLPTYEGIFFWSTDLSRQTSDQIVRGYIIFGEFTGSNCQECVHTWIKLNLRTGKTIWFWVVDVSGDNLDGWIYLGDYVLVNCGPLPDRPNVAGYWDSNRGLMLLDQTNYNYTIAGSIVFPDQSTGTITYATLWGNEVYGQWQAPGALGRFRWILSPDAKSFTGSFGLGDNFAGTGTWYGSKR